MQQYLIKFKIKRQKYLQLWCSLSSLSSTILLSLLILKEKAGLWRAGLKNSGNVNSVSPPLTGRALTEAMTWFISLTSEGSGTLSIVSPRSWHVWRHDQKEVVSLLLWQQQRPPWVSCQAGWQPLCCGQWKFQLIITVKSRFWLIFCAILMRQNIDTFITQLVQKKKACTSLQVYILNYIKNQSIYSSIYLSINWSIYLYIYLSKNLRWKAICG